MSDNGLLTSSPQGGSAAASQRREERALVRCGQCAHFVRDGRCDWYSSADAKRKDRPFAHAPFWVWSDCYSDKEQVRGNTFSACPTFVDREALNEPRGLSASEQPCCEAVINNPVDPTPGERG